MSIADTEPDTGRAYSCKIAALIAADEKPEAAATKVAEKFADTAISNRSLARWLGVAENTVNKHRAHACACDRT